jgi:hypothetical protein
VEATVWQTAPLQKFARDFHEAGFGVIREAIRPDMVAKLGDLLARMLPADPAGAPPALQQVVPRIVELNPLFADLATRPELVATLTAIFAGVVPQLVCSYGHGKPVRTRAHTVPHSDVAHLPGVPHHLSLLMVKAMFALTPVTRESGATVLAPGSHREAGEPGKTAAQPHHRVLLNPGDLLLFHANIRHTASDNTSHTPRLSVWLVYAQPWMRVFAGYEYGASFLSDLRPRLDAEPYLSAVYGLDDPYAT